MNTRRPRYHRHRFPPDIISHAVWLYHRYCMSFRDVEDLLAERGIIVSYETVRQWCGKFGPDYARQLKRRHNRRSWSSHCAICSRHGSRLRRAAGKAVVYQWETRKRKPSPVFWTRIEHLRTSGGRRLQANIRS